MDLSTVKSFIDSSLDIMKMSEAKYASFRIVRQDKGNYRVSLLLNSSTNLSGRNKSKAKIQRDAQRKKDFLSRKSAINPKSPEPTSHKEPRRVGTGNTDNTSRSPKNSVTGAGTLTGASTDHPEPPDVHLNSVAGAAADVAGAGADQPKTTGASKQAERSKVFPKTFSEIISTPTRPIAAIGNEITVNDELFTTPGKITTQNMRCPWNKAENCAFLEPPIEGPIPSYKSIGFEDRLCYFHRTANSAIEHCNPCDLHKNRSKILIPCNDSGNYCGAYRKMSSDRKKEIENGFM